MLSFTELDADFDDEILNAGNPRDADTFESPTAIARPAKRKGLTQQMSRKPVNVMEEEEVEEEEVYGDDRFGGGDGGGFADESYEHDEPLEGILQEEDYNLGEVDDEAEEAEEESSNPDAVRTPSIHSPADAAHAGAERSEERASAAPDRVR